MWEILIAVDLITVLIFAIGLCFDSFAVSISCGMSKCEYTPARGFRFAAIFGISHALMPLIGWLLGLKFHAVIESYDHWVSFVLLTILGGKMVKESLTHKCDDEVSANPFSLKRGSTLGLATSIDALIAGVAMAMVQITIVPGSSQLTNMLIAAGIIGLTTLIASLSGIFIGRKTRSKLGHKAGFIGGLVLIAIGVKVLVEHLWF